MKKQQISIKWEGRTIPATLWGEAREGVLLAIHGSMSNREDQVIARAAGCGVFRLVRGGIRPV